MFASVCNVLQRFLRAREKRKAQRYKDKSYFCKGQWNVNTVMMGGLGGDISPESSDKGELRTIFSAGITVRLISTISEDEDSLRKLNEKVSTKVSCVCSTSSCLYLCVGWYNGNCAVQLESDMDPAVLARVATD